MCATPPRPALRPAARGGDACPTLMMSCATSQPRRRAPLAHCPPRRSSAAATEPGGGGSRAAASRPRLAPASSPSSCLRAPTRPGTQLRNRPRRLPPRRPRDRRPQHPRRCRRSRQAGAPRRHRAPPRHRRASQQRARHRLAPSRRAATTPRLRSRVRSGRQFGYRSWTGAEDNGVLHLPFNRELQHERPDHVAVDDQLRRRRPG